MTGNTVHLPPFTLLDPELWFCRIENSFICAGIVDDQIKYSSVVSNLDPKYLGEVHDLVMNPPKSEMYNTLKSELIKRFSATQDRHVIRKLEKEQMGNRTPSQFLHHLRNLGGLNIPDELVRIFWQKRLPSSMQKVLTTQNDLQLDRIAELADAIAEFTITDSVVQILTETLTNISSQMVALSTTNKQAYEEFKYHMSNNRYQSQTVLAYDDYPEEDTCWYHKKQGSACQAPCSFDNLSHVGNK